MRVVGNSQKDSKEKTPSTVMRVLKYTLGRMVTLSISLVMGVFMAVVVTNFGGFVDNIYLDRIKGILFAYSTMMLEEGVPLEERVEKLNDLRWQLEEDMGLHTPFLDRCIRWTADALSFGYTKVSAGWKSPTNFEVEENKVIDSILEEVPGSLILFGTAMLPAFLISVMTALHISRNPGNWLDKLMVTLTPISSVPSWVYGVILTTIFAIKLFILPERGFISPTTGMTKLEYMLSVGKHLILPASSIILTTFFQSVYSWRTFFLLHSDEDYIDLARAKGLPPSMLERRYILRPTMPMIVTTFSMMILVFWQEIIALEVWFEWPGIGKMFIEALKGVNSAVTMTIIVIFAFLFVITVFLLDIIYALIDPRVRLNNQPKSKHASGRKTWFSPRNLAGIKSILRNSFIIIATGILLVSAFGFSSRGRSSPDVSNSATAPKNHPQIQIDFLQHDDNIASTRTGFLGMDTPPFLAEWLSGTESSEDAQDNPNLIIGIVTLFSAGLLLFMLRRLFPKRSGKPFMDLSNQWQEIKIRFKPSIAEFKKYPSGIVGITIVSIMIGISLYTLVTIPQKEVIELWRSHPKGSNRLPAFAPPAWTNWFRKEKLPLNLSVSSMEGDGIKTSTPATGDGLEFLIELPIDYQYSTFPQDVSLFIYADFFDKNPFVTLTWITPDGREIKLISEVIKAQYSTRLSWYIKNSRQQEVVLAEGNKHPMRFLFSDPTISEPTALKGVYKLRVEGITFERETDLNAEMALLGQVYGLAGTDHLNRNLELAVGWGILVAMAFGLIGAVTTSLLTMLIAAIGAWFGGWVDSLIQRITEINMMMPMLPIAFTVYFIYAKTVWAILGAVVILSIFGKEIKNYRSAFLQMKQEVYIEAAQSYGAGNWRIISRYLLPRIFPMMVPRLVVLMPGYVFLEATLAFLGAPDEYLPTLGKVIYEAFAWDALKYHLHWILIPLLLLVILGLSFAMIGLALDRVLNPRLREA